MSFRPKDIRTDLDAMIENQKNRFEDYDYLYKLKNFDESWRSVQFQYDNIKKNRKPLQKLLKITVESDKSNDIDGLYEQVISGNLNCCKSVSKVVIISVLKKMSDIEKLLSDEVSELKESINTLFSKVGNKLHKDANIGDKDIVMKSWDGYASQYQQKYGHFDLCRLLGVTDTDAGSRIAGNRGYFFLHNGVILNRALINYAFDFLMAEGYTMMSTPHFMNYETISKVAQLSEFEESLYKLDKTDTFLIATSEQPLTSYFANKLLDNLPQRIGGVSECYRKEAGSHGKDSLGIFRVHQFQKIEQFVVTTAENSQDEFYKMLDISERFYQSLGIGYRVVNIPSSDLNRAASIKFDIEAFYPASKTYREVVSCTNTLDYLSQKISCKHGDQYVHMLNATLCANTRTLCCILETYQQDDHLLVPDVLKKYVGKDTISFV